MKTSAGDTFKISGDSYLMILAKSNGTEINYNYYFEEKELIEED